MALKTACAFALWEAFCDLGPPHPTPTCSWLAVSPRAPQVGFQKRTGHLLGLHTQLELVLAGVSLLLAALLLGCFVALGVQYHRGRWAHTCPQHSRLWGLSRLEGL